MDNQRKTFDIWQLAQTLVFAGSVFLAYLFFIRGFATKYSISAKVEDRKAAEEHATLPDPDPLEVFDLVRMLIKFTFNGASRLTFVLRTIQKTATTRNHLYVNKTVRWPYFQVTEIYALVNNRLTNSQDDVAPTNAYKRLDRDR